MRVLALTKYSQLGASSRLRVFQYLGYLRSKGNEIMVEPLFEDEYLEALYSGRHPRSLKILARYAKRLLTLTTASSKFDLIWIQKELLPWIPAFVERLLLGGRIPWIVDYDDAVFHQYDLHRLSAVRCLLGHKVDVVMAKAHCVLAGNKYLADRAQAAGATNVQIIPTVVDLNHYHLPHFERKEQFTIGWIGTPITAKYLDLIAPALQQVAERIPIELMAVGSGEISLGLQTRCVAWHGTTEATSIAEFDVGIMPLRDGPFERGKCGYKLIQYMAMGKPVVASPVGVNNEIVRNGINGFLAKGLDDWVHSLLTLYHDVNLRQRMGLEGRGTIESHYSLESAAPRLASILEDVSLTDGRMRRREHVEELPNPTI